MIMHGTCYPINIKRENKKKKRAKIKRNSGVTFVNIIPRTNIYIINTHPARDTKRRSMTENTKLTKINVKDAVVYIVLVKIYGDTNDDAR